MGEPVTVERSSEVGKGPLGRASALASKPLRNARGFFAFSLDVLVMLFKPAFAWREFLDSVGLTGVGRERHSTADLRPRITLSPWTLRVPGMYICSAASPPGPTACADPTPRGPH